MRTNKLFLIFIFTASIAASAFSNAAQEMPDKDEAENALFEKFAKSLNEADAVAVGTVKNVVVGKLRNYAVIEVSKVMKGEQHLKTIYLGYDPDVDDEVFQLNRTGLWMLRAEEGSPYFTPLKDMFFEDTADLKMVRELLLKQNSTSPEDIEFTITTDKKKYLLDEPVRIEMTVKNNSDKFVTFDNSLLWRFTHIYSLTFETKEGIEKLTVEKSANGIIGEFAGPRFIRLQSGESTSRSFNLIKLISNYPPEGKSLSPQIPPCKASFEISWNTETLKEIFPDAESVFAIAANWASNDVKFRISSKKLDSAKEAIEAIENKSGIDNILDAVTSGDEKISRPAVEAFVEYASPGLEPELGKLLTSEQSAARDAAGRVFLWLAKHPRFMESDILLNYLSKSEEIQDIGAYNQVLSWIASAAIRQGRKDYVGPLVSVLKSHKATVLTKKEIVAALSALTDVDLSEENFDETIDTVKKWIEKETEEGPD